MTLDEQAKAMMARLRWIDCQFRSANGLQVNEGLVALDTALDEAAVLIEAQAKRIAKLEADIETRRNMPTTGIEIVWTDGGAGGSASGGDGTTEIVVPPK